MITATDGFCGAGGSSSGMVEARVKVKTAINHWPLALQTHGTNHPDTEHDCADLQATHPSRYPRTNILWMSPECTNHSLAKGRKRKNLAQLDLWGETGIDPAEERSRATMREVVEFTAFHRYEIVIVENVVDIRFWEHYESWLREMLSLGYVHRELYLNAQFFGVPQSRDRIYIVFWRKGMVEPDLDFRPPAICDEHGDVASVQVWKKKQWGRYGTNRQYVYCCPKCGRQVRPAHTPAWVAIDWSLPITRIGDRQKPLKAKTMERIAHGIRKFARPVVVNTAYAGDDGRAVPVDGTLPTQTSRQELALTFPPFISSQHNNSDGSSTRVREAGEPLPCITTLNNEHQLVVPPYLLSTNHSTDRLRDVGQALDTVMPQTSPSLVVPPFSLFMQGGHLPSRIDEPLHTIVASACQHFVVQPLVGSYFGAEWSWAQVSDPAPTITTVQRHSLIIPDEYMAQVGFRMLEPHELKRGMSFGEDYIILGNKREQVRQVGNAVCRLVAKMIVERCVAALERVA